MNNIIQTELKDISDIVAKHLSTCTGGYKVPEAYFDTIEIEFLPEQNTNPYTTPEGYFESLEDDLVAAVQQDTRAKVVPPYRHWKKLIPYMAAASIIVMLGVWSVISSTDDAEEENYMLAELPVEELEQYVSSNLDEISIQDLAIQDFVIEDYWIDEDLDQLEDELIDSEWTDEELLDFL